MVARLTYAAPKRVNCNCSVISVKGKKRNCWISRPWTEADVLDALTGGAFFVRNRHDFADAAAERAAGLGKIAGNAPGSIKRWLKGLKPDQIEYLKMLLTKELQP